MMWILSREASDFGTGAGGWLASYESERGHHFNLFRGQHSPMKFNIYLTVGN